MKVSIRNIGLIESADIDLKGLTVITGLNDIGKSVLSKTLFSVIKTVYKANELAIEERNANLLNVLQQIISVYRSAVRVTTQTSQDINTLLSGSVNTIYTQIKDNSQSNIDDAKIRLQDFRENLLSSISVSPINPAVVESSRKQLVGLFDTADKLIKYESINEERYKAFFNEVVIRSIFQGQFNTRGDKALPATINITEGDIDIVKVQVDKDKTTYFKVLSELLYNEATLIESPYVVQLSDFTSLALAYLPTQVRNVKQSNLPYHVRDISLKIRSGFGVLPVEYVPIFETIFETIGGTVHYDAQENTIVYEKGNGQKIRSYNIASGIKSFGLLQMFLAAGLGNPRSLLIIDEPEVHLHLKWQLAYAEVIVALAANGIPIIVSTHSPFFLEALSVFVKKSEKEDLVTIYNGASNEFGQTVFNEVPRDDLSVIFSHLSEPMATLQMLS